jgi:hypothetical protein
MDAPTLSAVSLLDVWERGSAQSPPARALTLLAAACPETPPDALAQLSIGRRDARLLALHASTFGEGLVGLAACHACGEDIELGFSVSDITVAGQPDGGEPAPLSVDGYELRLRMLNSLDLDAILDAADVPSAREVLLRRCVLTATLDGVSFSTAELPDHVLEAVDERLAAADPQADVRLAFCCPGCGAEGRQSFDIVLFLWRKIEAWASRILHDVHRLAAVYGWGEEDILAMSPHRRQAYLDMVDQ